MKIKKTYWTRLLKIVRQEWSRNNPDRKECFKMACVKGEQNKWVCTNCKGLFALSEVQCDHIEPVSNTIPNNIEEFLISFAKLHSNNLQILCKPCHKIKTREDAFKKLYVKTVNRIAKFLDQENTYVISTITSWKIMQKFDKLILKIESTENNQKFLKQMEKLKERYL